MNFPLASVARRSTATMLNLAIGGWLLMIPSQLYNSSELGVALFKNVAIDNLLSVVVAMIQLVFVYYMQGSLGLVFVGLRVEDMNGERPRFRNVLVRSIPYVSVFLLCKVLPTASRTNDFVAFSLGALFLLVSLFIVLSGCVVVLNRKRSLLDMISGTRVVKVYSINPR